ncbi:MAG: hypothetical protein ABI744_05730 [Chloroflexota bacterium]
MAQWHFIIRAQPTMPALAWVAAVRPGEVSVDCGTSVRTFDNGLVEGTWVGPADPALLPDSTTVFGSGLVQRDGALIAIPASHHLECIYFARLADVLVVSNSLPGLMTAAGLQLERGVNYSDVFHEMCEGCWLIDDVAPGGLQLRHQHSLIPTTTVPITAWHVENLVIEPDLRVRAERRPRETAWHSFAEFNERITRAAESLLANGHRPSVVALSGGYDSAAVAAIVARVGVRRAAGFTNARPAANTDDVTDSGADIAAALGMEFVGVDRLAYKNRTDLAEADFLATGMPGEEMIFLGIEPETRGGLLFNGYWAGTEWAEATRNSWRNVAPITTSGAGIGEYRLKADFAWVPLPVFGAIRTEDAPSLLDLPEMDPYRVGGNYDRPVARRLIEEAGLKRGTFATAKRAVNVLPARDGPDVFSTAARESIAQFAAANGETLDWHRRRPFSRYERALARAAQRLGLRALAGPLELRQERLIHFEPTFGNLVLRWAVSIVSARYAAVQRAY